MNIQKLSDSELNKIIPELCDKERIATVNVLSHLIELDSRKLYRELGYSSLYDFYTRKLKYSEGLFKFNLSTRKSNLLPFNILSSLFLDIHKQPLSSEAYHL